MGLVFVLFLIYLPMKIACIIKSYQIHLIKLILIKIFKLAWPLQSSLLWPCALRLSFAANLTPTTTKASLSLEQGACTTTRKDILAKNEASVMHREAIKYEHVRQFVKVSDRCCY